MNKITYDKRIAIYRDALYKLGMKNMFTALHNDINKLEKALSDINDDGKKDDLIEPIAALTITLEQVRLFFGINEDVCMKMDEMISALSRNIAEKAVSAEELKLIQTASGRSYNAEDIDVFEVKLCDNEVDCWGEKFTIEALKGLSKLFIGKVGILDGDVSKRTGTARIFSTELVSDDTRRTADGEVYTYIKAKIFSIKNADNKPHISSLKSGAKVETTIGCCVSKITCSVCGLSPKSDGCKHKKGTIYDNEKCFFSLEEPSAAYEFSVKITSNKKPSMPNVILKSFMKGVENYDA